MQVTTIPSSADTETSGKMPPICAVEIAGQRMKGREPERSLLMGLCEESTL